MKSLKVVTKLGESPKSWRLRIRENDTEMYEWWLPKSECTFVENVMRVNIPDYLFNNKKRENLNAIEKAKKEGRHYTMINK